MLNVYLEQFGEVSTVAVCLVLPALTVAALVMLQMFMSLITCLRGFVLFIDYQDCFSELLNPNLWAVMSEQSEPSWIQVYLFLYFWIFEKSWNKNQKPTQPFTLEVHLEWKLPVWKAYIYTEPFPVRTCTHKEKFMVAWRWHTCMFVCTEPEFNSYSCVMLLI